MIINSALWRMDSAYNKKLINQTGLTQQQLANRLGISRVQVGKWYTGKTLMPYPAQVCVKILADQNTDEIGQQIKQADKSGPRLKISNQ